MLTKVSKANRFIDAYQGAISSTNFGWRYLLGSIVVVSLVKIVLSILVYLGVTGDGVGFLNNLKVVIDILMVNFI